MTPLEAILATLLCFLAAHGLYRVSGHQPWLQPVITGILFMVIVLLATDTNYWSYFDSAQAIHTLLGTATVALAIPLYECRHLIRQHIGPIFRTLLATGILAIVTAIVLAQWLGLPDNLAITLAPKSVTTPFAIALTESFGGIPPLSAALVIVTGMIVALAGPGIARLAGISNPLPLGLAMGMTGHGIATARAFELSSEAGAFSALAMGLMGIYTSLLLPWILPLFGLH
ncbi:MAG: LrgB family protein [Gammaproteobacteria bacterium]|nr:MAG: LrgB family protein [Gammaproteobacteria bacterium]